MKALVIDTSDTPWQESHGFTLTDIDRPTQDDIKNLVEKFTELAPPA